MKLKKNIIYIIFSILLVLATISFVSADTETFTTTTDYSTANTVNWYTTILDKKSVVVFNDGSNTGTLRVRVRTTPDGEYVTLNTDTIDASGDTILYFDRYYNNILLEVKHGDGTTDMIIDYGHGGLY